MASDSALREEVEREIAEHLGWQIRDGKVQRKWGDEWRAWPLIGAAYSSPAEDRFWNALVDARLEVRQLRERVKELEAK